MYIKSMIIEGFKSYGSRTEIHGFDKEFNAITGLNGSGKSNILDAICFVLGISNLSQVRAGSLQELVYKSGQAGITKASVTIVFDNRDEKKSPLGYERYEEITVTRQTVIAGKNRYLINGSTVQNKRVTDLFNSVQLNVNNPHFLIMQGRITKVLNMKPPEILSMIEEAAGTRMYETKKQAAQKTIEKKDAKLQELNALVNEEIAPKLDRLKHERGQYLELQKVQRELEHVTKICIAYKYLCLENTSSKAQERLEEVVTKIQSNKEQKESGNAQIKELENQIEEMQRRKSAESDGQLEEREKELKDAEKIEATAAVKLKSAKDNISAEEKRCKQIEKSIHEDEKALGVKEGELGKIQDNYNTMKTEEEEDNAALAAAQKKFQAVSSGLMASDSGGDATLQDQLMAAKQEITQADTESKQCSMQLEHSKKQLAAREKEIKKTEKDYAEDTKQLSAMEKELTALEGELSKFNYEEGLIESLGERQGTLKSSIRKLRQQVESFESKNSNIIFRYQKPEPNFNDAAVRGYVCKLFKVKDKKFTTALETAAGGRLFNVIVDNEKISNLLIQKGRLQKRITFVPLNRIQGNAMDNRTIASAEQIAGKGRVFPALSLIDYEPQYKAAMQWLFGQVFVCADNKAANIVCYDNRIKKKCVTLDGDVYNPSGVISGGAAVKSASVLSLIEEMGDVEKQLAAQEAELAEVEREIARTSKVAASYAATKQKFEKRTHEVALVKQRFAQTSHHQNREEVDALKKTIEELAEKMEVCKQRQKEGSAKVKELTDKLKNINAIREKELKEAEKEMNRLKKKCDDSRKKWKQKEQAFDTLKLEIEELKKSIESGREQLATTQASIATMKEEVAKLSEVVSEKKDAVKELQGVVKALKESISKQNKEIQATIHKKEKLIKDIANCDLEVISLQHQMEKLKAEAKDAESKLKEMIRRYDWIEGDRQYFGKPNGIYDFEENDPKEASKRVAKLQETKEKLSRTVNTRAMNLLGKEEEQYNEMMRKKRIVENDKRKIEDVIKELDEKKRAALKVAWEQVNKDFGSIFSTLLPGTQAMLKPPDGKTLLDGLEVKIGFGGIWKESLGELSGGQRSLVALSLILAMLLFRPAPIYILDEVDAALDLSHTQNIGQMLKAHFKHSQFVIVSLKDGMFNNANVLFRTKFVEGMSTVTRTTAKDNAR
nr:PREDICTED: structural maintenance of chromosomes protein 2 [Bemisia tabaci]